MAFPSCASTAARQGLCVKKWSSVASAAWRCGRGFRSAPTELLCFSTSDAGTCRTVTAGNKGRRAKSYFGAPLVSGRDGRRRARGQFRGPRKPAFSIFGITLVTGLAAET